MTFSKYRRLWALVFVAAPAVSAWAGLGESEGSIAGDRMRMRAFHSVARVAQYSIHDLKMEDGSRVRQYVTGNGRIFAVTWSTLYKPDLSKLLGSSFPEYRHAANESARHGGIQRNFRLNGDDLVLQSSGHLNVYHGYAYRRSMMPKGMDLQMFTIG